MQRIAIRSWRSPGSALHRPPRRRDPGAGGASVEVAPAGRADRTGAGAVTRSCVSSRRSAPDLTVPLDPDDPGGPMIKIAVSRILHTKEPYRGAVLHQPRWPWRRVASACAVAGSSCPNGVGKTYDWYGIDPRGVGASRPALTCDNQYFGWNRTGLHAFDRRHHEVLAAQDSGLRQGLRDRAGACGYWHTCAPPTSWRTTKPFARRSPPSRSPSSASRTARTSRRSMPRSTQIGSGP